MTQPASKKRFRPKITGPMLICVGTILFFSIFAKNFFSVSNAVNIIRQACVLAIVAFGQTFAILIQGFDLSVGAVMGLVSCMTAVLMVKGITSVGVAVALSLGVAILCGLTNGFVTNYIGLNPFVSTFGMWGMALGAALVISEEKVIFGFPATLRFLHDGELVGIPIPLLIVLVIWMILHLFLKVTPYGTATYAIGGNPTAAELSGIPVRFYKTMIYTFSGLMAGFAGIMFLARSNAAQAVDTIGYEFDSIVAVVVGGTSLAGGKGGVAQTLIGVALLAAVRNGLNMMGVNMYLRFPKIDAVIGINDAMALGAKEAVKDAKRMQEMFLVGMDAMPEALDGVRSGELMATVDANNFWQGFVSTELTCKYLLSKQLPAKETKIGSGIPEVITKENLERFINFKAERYKKYGLKPI